MKSILGAAAVGNLAGASLLAGDALPTSTVWVVKVDTSTGKLVRSLVPASKRSADSSPDVRSLLAEAAKTHNVDPLLVDSMIQVESNYNAFAVSPTGAQGLMQLMPGTAKRFGVTNRFDPRQNIEAGVRYLKFLQDTFHDDRLALAAYNAGEKAVTKYKGVPAYPETVSYVAKVSQEYSQAKRAALHSHETRQMAKDAKQSEQTEEAPRHILSYVDTQGKLHIASR